jgi:hypothetical protein
VFMFLCLGLNRWRCTIHSRLPWQDQQSQHFHLCPMCHCCCQIRHSHCLVEYHLSLSPNKNSWQIFVITSQKRVNFFFT